MTVIAWDGITLAADRRATRGGTISATTKIRKTASGDVLAYTGSLSTGLLLLDWYEDGANPEDWPEVQNDDDWARLIVFTRGGLFYYETHAVRIPVIDPFIAFGSGGEVALGALAMGATAIQAVEIASRFQSDCGNGCDSFNV